MAQAQEEIVGTFESIRYSKDDSPFMIGLLKDKTVVKGNAYENRYPAPGLDYRFIGTWETHPKFGKQFKFSSFAMQEPRTREAVIAYILRYTTSCGIGPTTASRIVDAYGPEKALAIIKWEPERVSKEIRGLSLANAKIASVQLQGESQFESTLLELTQLLGGRGFSGETFKTLIKKWKTRAPEIVKRDPFKLLVEGIPGAGFGRCDALYSDLGLPRDRLKRQVICIWDIIRKDMTGSVWFDAETLERQLRERCGGGVKFQKALELGIRSEWLRAERVDGRLFVSSESDAGDEDVISDVILRMVNGFSRTQNDFPEVYTAMNARSWLINEKRRVMG